MQTARRRGRTAAEWLMPESIGDTLVQAIGELAEGADIANSKAEDEIMPGSSQAAGRVIFRTGT